MPSRLRGPAAREQRQTIEKIRHEAEHHRRTLLASGAPTVSKPLAAAAALVVMAIAGALLAGRAQVNLQPHRKRPARLVAQEELDVLQTALDLFRRDCGRYPTAEEGLLALITNPGERDWGGAYVTLIKPDPWKQRYRYALQGSNVLLASSGPDQAPDTPDDLTP